MIDVFKTENAFGTGEVRSWASLLDENCRRQAEAISRVPILDGYLALMPDAHFGYGPPVGSALITTDAIMPYAVGSDIGCGMIAIKTTIERGRFGETELRRLAGNVRTLIPSGPAAHETPSELSDEFFAGYGDAPGLTLFGQRAEHMASTARRQFGTLGAGNHFVEACVGFDSPEAPVWLVLHSGSRGIGKMLCDVHVAAAKAVCMRDVERLESPDFAFVRRGDPAYGAYIADMVWAQNFAHHQREAMMEAFTDAVKTSLGITHDSLDYETVANCHHNYAEEIAPGRWLTRKGAIDASLGAVGVIPGSMGAATYIVRGLGNEEAYCTSPHGAGRLLGRGVARRTLSLDDFRAQMGGRTWQDRDADELLDEAPGAYKPIETVIADSASLVETTAVLSQFFNYKGVGSGHGKGVKR